MFNKAAGSGPSNFAPSSIHFVSIFQFVGETLFRSAAARGMSPGLGITSMMRLPLLLAWADDDAVFRAAHQGSVVFACWKRPLFADTWRRCATLADQHWRPPASRS